MKILFASSEATPFAKTGGLADVAGSLPSALAALGHDVRLVMPRYGSIDPVKFNIWHLGSFPVALIGQWQEECGVSEGKLKDVPVYFIEKNSYFDRPSLYQTIEGDYPDNAERFAFFSRAILELCRMLDFDPEIIHCNDWQTGPVPFFLKTLYRGEALFQKTRSVFTIHNLGYQGIFPKSDMRFLGDAWAHYHPEGLEYWNNISYLKAGIVYSDVITTVSETYSREIQTPEYGFGFEGVLRRRAPDLYGIVNGIDYDEWGPERDATTAAAYKACREAGTIMCRHDFLKETGLAVADAPVIGMVTRLATQKGLDILTQALPEIMDLGMQCVILGTGEPKFHEILNDAAGRYPLKVHLTYNDALARQIYAGSDIFLMPSRYEPCGLGQLIALRYGSVPVVRKTGGLSDTVQDFDPATGKGTGFVFEEYSARALVECLRRAGAVYGDVEKWKRLREECMKQDFSWNRSAREYEKVYGTAVKR